MHVNLETLNVQVYCSRALDVLHILDRSTFDSIKLKLADFAVLMCLIFTLSTWIYMLSLTRVLPTCLVIRSKKTKVSILDSLQIIKSKLNYKPSSIVHFWRYSFFLEISITVLFYMLDMHLNRKHVISHKMGMMR